MSDARAGHSRSGSSVEAGNGSGGSSATLEGTVNGRRIRTSYVETVGARGRGDSSVPAISTAVVCNRLGEVVALKSDVTDAVDAFQAPQGYVRKGAREGSFMYSLGAYVEALRGERHMYFCLADAMCREKQKIIPCKGGDRSNVNSHLKHTHGLQGMGGVVKGKKRNKTAAPIRREKDQSVEKKLPASGKSSGAGKGAAVGTDRVRELLAVRLVVDKFLPLSFFASGTTWRELAGFLAANTRPFPELPPHRVKHLLAEMYLVTKEAVIGNIQEEIKKAALPIVHYGLDLRACRVSGRKYLDIHVFYVSSDFTLRRALLAVKHYDPCPGYQGTEVARQALFKIFEKTLGECGIRLSDLAGGTTNSGPDDVKGMCVNILSPSCRIWWDECDRLLADEAVEMAFGTSEDPRRCKNEDAREVVKLVMRAARKANRSSAFNNRRKSRKRKINKGLEDELELEMILGETSKTNAKQQQQHHHQQPLRSLSLLRVMERTIRRWHVLRRVYADDGEDFPLEEKGGSMDDVLQLYSLLRPLSAITRDGQRGSSTPAPMTAEMHMAFAQLKAEVLDPKRPLRVFGIPPTPTSPEAEQEDEEDDGNGDSDSSPVEQELERARPELPSRLVPSGELRPIAVKTRKELSKALVQLYYGRVWDETADDDHTSPFRDAAVVLTPPFNTGKYLHALRLTAADAEHLPHGRRGSSLAPTTEEDVAEKLRACWGDIKTRAWRAAREQHGRSSASDADGQPPLKRPRAAAAAGTGAGAADVSASSATARRSKFSSFGRGGGGGGDDDDDGAENEAEGESSEDKKLGELVTGEIERYKSLFMRPVELDCREVLHWWGRTGKSIFPHLAPVAQQVFGNQAALAQVDRDFGACSNLLLAPTRSRMDTYWVEVVMFLKANLEHIPEPSRIPAIPAKSVRASLPSHFTRKDELLTTAVAAFEVLTNTVDPSTEDIGLED